MPTIPDDDSDDINKSISNVACGKSTFICIDPAYIGQPTNPDDTCEEEGSDTEEDDCFELIENIFDDRVGNGVCDPCLNTAHFDFDGGDCCAETCQINRSFPDSCAEFCRCQVDAADLVDTQPPEFIFEVPLLSETTVDVSVMGRPPVVSAFDNSGAAPTVEFDETRIDGDCANQYTLERSWTATDASGNTASFDTIIHVVDETPPVLPSSSSPLETTCLILVAESIDSAPDSVAVPLSLLMGDEGTMKDQCLDDSNTYCSSDVTASLSTCEALVVDETTDIDGNCTHNAIDGEVLLEFGQLFAKSSKEKKKEKNNDGDDGERFLRKKGGKKKDDGNRIKCSEISNNNNNKDKKKIKGWCDLLKATFEIEVNYKDACGNSAISSDDGGDQVTTASSATVVVQWIIDYDPTTTTEEEASDIPEYCDRTIFFDFNGLLL